ncbi:MAG: OmpA family protein [Bacteroidota bacterium]
MESVRDPYILEIPLSKITAPTNEAKDTFVYEKPIVLKNVFFETGSAELLPSSTQELNTLKSLLEENPSISIQLNGHTDDVGSDEDNLNLSLARAKSVYTYLIDQGISESRLSYKGFGETMPIDTNDTEQGRQNNRRTEFIILR